MSSYAYYNGKFGKKSEITIPLTDRSIYFGDGVYDAAIGKNGMILWEDEHILRLLGNSSRLGIKHCYSPSALSELLHKVIDRSKLKQYFIYFALSGNCEMRNHSTCTNNGANLLIVIDEHNLEVNQKPIQLITKEDKRYGYCNIKTTNLLPSVLALTEAEAVGCDEVVFIKNGFVTECAKSNISILKYGRMITHPISPSILPGITRSHLIKACEGISMPIEERPFTPEELIDADEIIVSSSSKLCRTANRLDGIKVGGKDPASVSKIFEIIFLEYNKLHN